MKGALGRVDRLLGEFQMLEQSDPVRLKPIGAQKLEEGPAEGSHRVTVDPQIVVEEHLAIRCEPGLHLRATLGHGLEAGKGALHARDQRIDLVGDAEVLKIDAKSAARHAFIAI